MIQADPAAAGFAASLELAMSAPGRLTGFAAPPRETMRRARLPRQLLDDCRRSLAALLPSLEAGGVLAVASAERGEGRTTTAAAIAAILARDTRMDVVLADLDFERPALAELFGVRSVPGLSDFAERETELRILPGEPDRRLWLLPGGSRPPDPGRPFREIMRGDRLAVLRERFGWVVLDLPPVLETPGFAVGRPLLDWVVFLGRYRATPLASVRRALEILDPDPERTGFVLSADASRIPRRVQRLL